MEVNGDGNEDWNLAKKLKHEDPVQFHTLVRMHLSFVLDLNTDDCDSQPEKSKLRSLKWSFVPFSKKSKLPNKSSEGLQLTKDAIYQFYKLTEFLRKDDNVVQEGIFRRTGKLTRQQELKLQLTNGVKIDLNDGDYSVHDCASVLKTFLAELNEPLLTEAYFPAYCQVAELSAQKPHDERLQQALQLLVLLLPAENWLVLKDVLQLLHLVASHEPSNKMTAENLATLFTPHLLCPRKLAPEALHSTAQTLTKVVAMMITQGADLFNIPSSLATDIRMYWERRKQSPDAYLNESSAATTVFSFVDRERTAQENLTDPTDAALAQLYAHIQALPESSKKRRLVKQFNRENGCGTPDNRTRSFGDSIKKHIFNKTLKPARGFCEIGQLKKRSSSEEILHSPETKSPKCFQIIKVGKSCENLEIETTPSPVGDKLEENSSSSKKPTDPEPLPIASPLPYPGKENSPFCTPCNPPRLRQLSVSKQLTPANRFSLLTSTPAPCHNCLMTPSPADDMSPITMSTQRMSKAMQETMMTPRSRKPVVAVSASNINHLPDLTWGIAEESSSHSPQHEHEYTNTDSLSGAFRDYLSSRSVLTASPVDLSFSSRTGDFDPSSEPRIQDFETSNEEKVLNSPLSESLLYVLDGNLPSNLSSDSSGCGESRQKKRSIEEGIECDYFTPNKRSGRAGISTSSSGLGFSENSRDVPHETSL